LAYRIPCGFKWTFCHGKSIFTSITPAVSPLGTDPAGNGFGTAGIGDSGDKTGKLSATPILCFVFEVLITWV
jgi:hypothetical protein